MSTGTLSFWQACTAIARMQFTRSMNRVRGTLARKKKLDNGQRAPVGRRTRASVILLALFGAMYRFLFIC